MAKYPALPGEGKPADLGFVPSTAFVNAVWMDESVIPGCMFNHASWIRQDCTCPGLIKHGSDALLMFIGGDVNNYETLNAEIELRIENDTLHLTNTCFVFIPAGTAYGDMVVHNLKRPVFYYALHLNTSVYQAVPAQATAPAGTWANQAVEKYAPVDGHIPEAPEGFLDFLLWIDGQKLPGAPYMEAVWFKSANDTGPEGHVHDFDEIIGFIGSDPDHPEDLGATVQFAVGDRIVTTDKSTLFYVPRGTHHSPIVLPELHRPLFHFSGGNGGDYVRK